EAYAVRVFSASGVAFDTSIPLAVETPQPSVESGGSFALVGFLVGVVPVALGMLWLPALRASGPRGALFVLPLAGGVLRALGVDTLAEALDQSARLPETFGGPLLVGVGAFATVAVLAALSLRRRGPRGEGAWSVARLVALGIGLHNLGEGLAIGAAYA